MILYDRRGCTRSERPDPYETSVVQHAEDAAALLLALDAVPAVVIRRSYGGATALEAGEGSAPAFCRVTERMAAAIPNSQSILVSGGHFIDPGEPDVLKFMREVLVPRSDA